MKRHTNPDRSHPKRVARISKLLRIPVLMVAAAVAAGHVPKVHDGISSHPTLKNKFVGSLQKGEAAAENPVYLRPPHPLQPPATDLPELTSKTDLPSNPMATQANSAQNHQKVTIELTALRKAPHPNLLKSPGIAVAPEPVFPQKTAHPQFEATTTKTVITIHAARLPKLMRTVRTNVGTGKVVVVANQASQDNHKNSSQTTRKN